MTIVCLVLTCCGRASHGQGSDKGTWITRNPLPTPRQEMPHAVLDGKVYVVGGLDRIPNGSRVVEVYDPSTGAWEERASMPLPLHHLGVAAFDGKLYVLGGYLRNSFGSTTALLEYDPETDVWTTLEPMPTSRGAHAVAVLGGKIYVTGGTSFGQPIRSVETYDPLTGTWETRAPMLGTREHHTAAVVDSMLFVMGGRLPIVGNVATVEAYDPETDTWSRRTSMPTARSGLAGAALYGRIFVFGGEIPGVYTENEMYDPGTDLWETMAPMPIGRHGIGTAVVNDTIFIIGGAPNEGFGLTDVNQGYVPPASITTAAEQSAPNELDVMLDVYPNPVAVHSTARVRFGGRGELLLDLRDALGRTVRSTTVSRSETLFRDMPIGTDDLAPGVYFVVLRRGNLPIAQRGLVVVRGS